VTVRERWFGATGKRVPAIAVEGVHQVPLEEALVLDDVSDTAALARAHARGTPVVVRARSVDEVRQALARPEVACALVPPEAGDLAEVDLRELTYGP
jgi:hypothetical protein